MAKAPKKQGPTAEERALQQVSSAQWNDYKERFRPAEKALALNAKLTDGERAQVKGEVAADTAQAFSGLTRSTISAGEQAGADVNSGKTKLSLAGNAAAMGKARGVGQAMAETGAELDSEGRFMKIAGFGREVAAGATADMSRGAVRATRLALAASNAKFEKNQAMIGAVATVAGAAASKFNEVRVAKQKARLSDLASEKHEFGGMPNFDFDSAFPTRDPFAKVDPFKNMPNPFGNNFLGLD